MTAPDKSGSAVYVSWKTFVNSLDQLAKAEIPNVIDKTVFTGMAFSVQNQLFAGMRFLGLIDEKSKPLPDLEALATTNESMRREKLKVILHSRYADLFAINLKKTTPDEIEKKMAESYGVSGATREKAVRFFLSAAEYVGTELSPLLASKKPGRTAGVRQKRAPKKQTQDPGNGSVGAATTPGTSKTVRLQSGGTLTLSATLDLFSLNAEDRKFIFDLIDRLESYVQPEMSNPSAAPEG